MKNDAGNPPGAAIGAAGGAKGAPQETTLTLPIPADELARLRADAARLDALDRANAALNQQHDTTYRWRCDANHNRVSLTDMHANGYPTVREAIDAWQAGKR